MGPRSLCRNVLVVDDDDDARRLIHSRLAEDARTGMVWEATDPLTASALVEFLPVDVVVLDFLLAQGTAVDCLPALRRHRPDSRIVVYTASMQLARGAHVLGLGADQLVHRWGFDVDQDIGSIAFGSPSLAAVSAGRSGPSSVPAGE
jgi:DNA-binding NarL/FixJ family response regulator